MEDICLQTYRVKGGEANKQNAIEHLENALHFWDEVVAITRPIYNDMPLAALQLSARKQPGERGC